MKPLIALILTTCLLGCTSPGATKPNVVEPEPGKPATDSSATTQPATTKPIAPKPGIVQQSLNKEVICDARIKSKPKVVLKWQDLVVEQSHDGHNCHLTVKHNPNVKPKYFRRFTFNEAGKIFVYSEFNNPLKPNSTFATSGVKAYYLLPALGQLKAVLDREKGEFYIRMPSGEKIYFDGSPMRINEQKTTDLSIHQQAIAYHNAGGFSVSNPNGVLVNVGYLQGGQDNPHRKLILKVANGGQCKVPHGQLFDYYFTSYKVKPGTCPTSITAHCECLSRGQKRERLVCSNEYRLTYKELRGKRIGGYRLKDNVARIIGKRCPSAVLALNP